MAAMFNMADYANSLLHHMARAQAHAPALLIQHPHAPVVFDDDYEDSIRRSRLAQIEERRIALHTIAVKFGDEAAEELLRKFDADCGGDGFSWRL